EARHGGDPCRTRPPGDGAVPGAHDLAADFFAAGFFAAVFLVAVLFFAAGARSRRSARSSCARSMVLSSTVPPVRGEALVSPWVTYGPNRPSLTTTGFFEFGSSPSSRSGGAAAARPRPRCLGCANSSLACSIVTVSSSSSDPSDRESEPFFRY